MGQTTSRTGSGCSCGCGGHDAGTSPQQRAASGIAPSEEGAASGVVPGHKTGNLLGLRDVSAPASGGCGCGGHGSH